MNKAAAATEAAVIATTSVKLALNGIFHLKINGKTLKRCFWLLICLVVCYVVMLMNLIRSTFLVSLSKGSYRGGSRRNTVAQQEVELIV